MADANDAVASASDIGDMLCLLAATPVRLEALSRDVGEERLRRRPSDDAWSANEILAHLRACADV